MKYEEKTPATGLDLAWGAQAIAEECGLPLRKTFYLLETGSLPARKVGHRWVAERGKLREFFLEV